MARVKRAVNAHKKRRVILERASGYRGQRSRLYRKAKEQVTHRSSTRTVTVASAGRLPSPVDPAHQRGRACERHHLQPLHPGLGLAGVQVDRRMLAELAVSDPATFASLVATAKAALPADVNAAKASA